MPGNEQVSPDNWSVHRQDDNGNHFVVSAGLHHEEALRLAAELESRGHKQLYWVERDRGVLPIGVECEP